MTPNGRKIVGALLWAFAIFVFGLHVAGMVRRTGLPVAGNDFPAFYCAGKAILERADPYATEPLRSCEHALPRGSDLPAQYVTPAPLPPYALDMWALVAKLAYPVAAWLFFIVLGASCVWLALALARVTNLPSGAIACSLLLCAALGSVVFGQIPPLVTLAVVLCGAALLRGNDVVAAICAACATIEPHVGLPVALALFMWRPATRIALVALGLIAAAAGVLAVSPPVALAYLTTVLPAHAQAELLTVDQFSLSHVLARAGVADRTALVVGTLSYLLTLALGVVAAKAASRRLGVAAIAYVPAATALLAGTFVHEIQMVAALPAAFLCIARGPALVAWAGRLVVAVVAAVPFTVALGHSSVIDALALASAGGALVACVADGEKVRWSRAIGAFALAAACVVFAVTLAHVHVPVSHPAAAAQAVPTSTDASVNWGAYLRSDPRYDTLQLAAEAAKAPVWIGLLALLLSLLGTSRPHLGLTTQPAWDRRPEINLSS
ncbi:MAG: glycosyltransferase family 87 protein [Candidatus Tyrphobacter sp.]